MGDARIKIAQDKAATVQALLASDETTGPFQTYADIAAFAAALGFKHCRRSSLSGEISKRDPAPVNRETFSSRGYEMLLNLISVAEAGDPTLLALDESSNLKRLTVFEEYVNGGLEILTDVLRGSTNFSEQLILWLSQEKEEKIDASDEELDLSMFL